MANHFALKYHPETDMVECACGAEFAMHYSEDGVYSFDSSCVECKDCLPTAYAQVVEALLKTVKMLHEYELERIKDKMKK